MRHRSVPCLLCLLCLRVLVMADETHHFCGGSLSFSFINETRVRIRTLLGWELGYGPCGTHCDRTQIGKNTAFSRAQVLKSRGPVYFGSWTKEVTKTMDVTSDVNGQLVTTLSGINDHLKWELENGGFEVTIDPLAASTDIILHGNYWKHLNSVQGKRDSSYHLQVKIHSGRRNDTGKANSSPLVLFKPVYSIPLNAVSVIKLSTMDDDGDVVHCQDAVFIETGGLDQMKGVHIQKDTGGDKTPNPALLADAYETTDVGTVFIRNFRNCSIVINATESNKFTDNGQMAVLVKVMDYNFRPIKIEHDHMPFRHPLQVALGAAPVQFLVRSMLVLLDPRFVDPTPEEGRTMVGYAGARIEITLAASPHKNSTEKIETISVIAVPSISFTLSNLIPDPRRASDRVMTQLLTVDTTSKDIGTYMFQTTVFDTGGMDGKERNYVIVVKENNLTVTDNISSTEARAVFPEQNVLSCPQDTTCTIPVQFTQGTTGATVVNSTIPGVGLGSLRPANASLRNTFQSEVKMTATIPGNQTICLQVSAHESHTVSCMVVLVIPTDPCLSEPCGLQGECFSSWDTYKCVCKPHITGKHCEVVIDMCKPSPCVHGTCMSFPTAPGIYFCQCEAGWSDKNCDKDIDECASSPCQNNALCNNLINSYSCTCRPGFKGDNCENVMATSTVNAPTKPRITGPTPSNGTVLECNTVCHMDVLIALGQGDTGTFTVTDANGVASLDRSEKMPDGQYTASMTFALSTHSDGFEDLCLVVSSVSTKLDSDPWCVILHHSPGLTTPSGTMIPESTPTATQSRSATTTPRSMSTASPTSSPTTTPRGSPTTTPTSASPTKPVSMPGSTPMSKPASRPTTASTTPPTSIPAATPSNKPATSPTSASTTPSTSIPATTPMTQPATTPTSASTPPPTSIPAATPMSKSATTPTSASTTPPTSIPAATPSNQPATSPTSASTPPPMLIPAATPSSMPTAKPMSASTTPSSKPATTSSAPTTPPASIPAATPMSKPATTSSAPTTPPASIPAATPMSKPAPTSSAPTTPPASIRAATTVSKPSPTSSAPITPPASIPAATPMSKPATTSSAPKTPPTSIRAATPMSKPATTSSAPKTPPTSIRAATPSSKPAITSSAPTTPPTSIPAATPTSKPATTSSAPTTRPASIPVATPTSKTAPTSSAPTTPPASVPAATPMSKPATTSSAPTTRPASVPAATPTSKPATTTSAPPTLPASVPVATPTSKTAPTSSEPTTPPASVPVATPSSKPATTSSAPTTPPTSIPAATPMSKPATTSSAPTTPPASIPAATPMSKPAPTSSAPTTPPASIRAATTVSKPSPTSSAPITPPASIPAATPMSKPATTSSAPTTPTTSIPAATPTSKPATASSAPTTRPASIPAATPTSKPATTTSAPPTPPASVPVATPTSKTAPTSSAPTTPPASVPAATPMSKPATTSSAPTTRPASVPAATPTSKPATTTSAPPTPPASVPVATPTSKTAPTSSAPTTPPASVPVATPSSKPAITSSAPTTPPTSIPAATPTSKPAATSKTTPTTPAAATPRSKSGIILTSAPTTPVTSILAATPSSKPATTPSYPATPVTTTPPSTTPKPTTPAASFVIKTSNTSRGSEAGDCILEDVDKIVQSHGGVDGDVTCVCLHPATKEAVTVVTPGRTSNKGFLKAGGTGFGAGSAAMLVMALGYWIVKKLKQRKRRRTADSSKSLFVSNPNVDSF